MIIDFNEFDDVFKKVPLTVTMNDGSEIQILSFPRYEDLAWICEANPEFVADDYVGNISIAESTILTEFYAHREKLFKALRAGVITSPEVVSAFDDVINTISRIYIAQRHAYATDVFNKNASTPTRRIVAAQNLSDKMKEYAAEYGAVLSTIFQTISKDIADAHNAACADQNLIIELQLDDTQEDNGPVQEDSSTDFDAIYNKVIAESKKEDPDARIIELHLGSDVRSFPLNLQGANLLAQAMPLLPPDLKELMDSFDVNNNDIPTFDPLCAIDVLEAETTRIENGQEELSEDQDAQISALNNVMIMLQDIYTSEVGGKVAEFLGSMSALGEPEHYIKQIDIWLEKIHEKLRKDYALISNEEMEAIDSYPGMVEVLKSVQQEIGQQLQKDQNFIDQIKEMGKKSGSTRVHVANQPLTPVMH